MTYKNIVITPEMIEKTNGFWEKHQNAFTMDDETIFYCGCFCILAPQAKFKNNSEIIQTLKNKDFFHIDINLNDLIIICRKTRFHNVKSQRLIDFKKVFPSVLNIIRSDFHSHNIREWLVQHVNGFGMKAASHFLRNVGKQDVAILDTHVFKFLECDPPKSKEAYLMTENIFRNIADKNNLSIGSLDLIVWRHYADVSWEEYLY